MTNNRLLWISVISLMVIGLVSMYFIGPYAVAKYGMTESYGPNLVFNKYFPYIIVGVLLMLGCSRLSPKWVLRTSWVLGIISLVLMLMTVVMPHTIHGSARYVILGGIPIDPFVMMLPAYVVWMAHWLGKDKKDQTWVTVGATILTMFIVCAAFMAPYMFMAQVYLLLFLFMGIAARKTSPGVFHTSIIMLAVFIAFMVLGFVMMPHVQYRMLGILHGTNYASAMSMEAIKNSALIGSTTESLSALSKMPDSITVFILSSIVAKFGILLGVTVAVLMGFLGMGIGATVSGAKDQFAKFLSLGVFEAFGIFVLLAMLVSLNFILIAAHWPIIGFGGTMTLSWCTMFGFVIAMNKNNK